MIQAHAQWTKFKESPHHPTLPIYVQNWKECFGDTMVTLSKDGQGSWWPASSKMSRVRLEVRRVSKRQIEDNSWTWEQLLRCVILRREPPRVRSWFNSPTKTIRVYSSPGTVGRINTFHIWQESFWHLMNTCCIWTDMLPAVFFSFQVSFLAKRRYQSSAFIKLSQQRRPTMSRLKAMESQVSVFL